jgi:hypothetical protein
VQVDYIYGRNWETDREFRTVEELATKMVTKELWTNHDYSNFVISGTDKVPMESKIRLLDVDIEKLMDR